MALDVYFTQDLRQIILAGMIATIETAHSQGMSNIEFVYGALALAKHQALAFGIPWTSLLTDAKQALGSDVTSLLDFTQQRLTQ